MAHRTRCDCQVCEEWRRLEAKAEPLTPIGSADLLLLASAVALPILAVVGLLVSWWVSP